MSESSARLSTLYIGVSGNLGSTVRPSGRFKLASSAPTKARSSASVGGAARSRGTSTLIPEFRRAWWDTLVGAISISTFGVSLSLWLRSRRPGRTN